MNYLKNQIIKELPLEISNKSIETTNPNSLTLLKEHIRSLESEIYFLRDKLRVKSDLIKLLLSSKSAETPVTIQTPDNVDPKNPLNGIQKEKKNANKNSINDLISISLDTRKSNLTEINIGQTNSTSEIIFRLLIRINTKPISPIKQHQNFHQQCHHHYQQ